MLKSIYPVITKEKELPFYISGIGESDPEYNIKRENGLTSHQFLYTISGEGQFKCLGKEMLLKENDFLYMPPGIVHEYRPKDLAWNTRWIVFRGQNIDSLMQGLGFVNWFVKNIEDISDIKKSFERLLKLSELSENGEKCSIFLYELILSVKNLCLSKSSPIANNHIQKAIKFMEEN
ncbi:MAG: AraC family ligand binding domain-containing protein, partial [Treponema sp.]|nr:AraC family ligand binding domain-containing protein [Treponema sp.]